MFRPYRLTFRNFITIYCNIKLDGMDSLEQSVINYYMITYQQVSRKLQTGSQPKPCNCETVGTPAAELREILR